MRERGAEEKPGAASRLTPSPKAGPRLLDSIGCIDTGAESVAAANPVFRRDSLRCRWQPTISNHFDQAVLLSGQLHDSHEAGFEPQAQHAVGRVAHAEPYNHRGTFRLD